MRVNEETKRAHNVKIVAAQQTMRDDIGLLVIQGVDSKKAYTFKVSRDEAIRVSERLAHGDKCQAIIQHQSKMYIKTVLNVVINPSIEDLAYPMRWVFQVLVKPQFYDLKQAEISYIQGGN